MTLLQLSALDTLFFRDGKPFSMGFETWADGIFPPPPSVFYGVLRTAFLSENIEKLKDANTAIDESSNLKIRFSAFYHSQNFYFPCPLDIVKVKEKNSHFQILSLKQKKHHSNLELPCTLQSEKEVENPTGLIDKISLNDYLIKSKEPKSLKSDYLIEEPKIGIGINNSTKASDDGMLYRVGMNRLKEIGFAIGYEGIALSSKGILKLGGEAKAVSFSTLTNVPEIKMPNALSSEYFKVYLATPAIFNEGWKPSQSKFGDARLIAACVGKPVYIGGFDMKPKSGKPRPKPMRRAVPAGSVYYYEGSYELAKSIHSTSISDYGAEQGFGIAYIGDVKERQK